jgi:anti-anti-sigma factor
MRAHQHAAPLVVVRSEAESGRVGLRLIGELDLNTVELLEAQLAASREQAPPAVIDLTELRFLDLAGLRALMRNVQADGAPATRLVGATGIVRRLIELTQALDGESAGANGSPFSGVLAANGNGNGAAPITNGNGNGNGRASFEKHRDAP